MSDATPQSPARSGTGAPLLWRREAPPPGICTKDADRLDATEVRADADAVYIDLVHRTVIPEQSHPPGPVEVAILVDGCPPATEPRISGAVWRDFASPSTATIPLDDLPDGDLDIALRAFGQEQVVLLNKSGRSVRRISDAERRSARHVAAAPEFGLPAAVLFELKDCTKEGVR